MRMHRFVYTHMMSLCLTQELAGALKRVRARSLPLATLERRRLAQPLGTRFLLRHLCGAGLVTVRQTPTGPAVSLTPRQL